MAHRANNIRLEDSLVLPSERVWVADHDGCAGHLVIVDDDWACDGCDETFHDDHCADIVAERKDKEAREACARDWQKDEHGALGRLVKAREEIAAELAGKRRARALSLGGMGDHEAAHREEFGGKRKSSSDAAG